MEVRIATVDDAEGLFGLNELFENDTTIGLLKKSLIENGREVVCIAYVGGVPAGYCSGLIVRSMCYAECRGDIEALFVREEYRRQGVGRALLKCLEKALAAYGVAHYHINTHAENKNAQSLYRELGYIKTGEILMEKTNLQ